MPRTTRTTATRPFGDLSPTQFEAVVRQVLGNLDGVIWEAKPDPIGHLGSDDGQDIRAVELSRGPKRTTKRPWLVQVKRYKEIHPKDLRDIVDAAIPAGSKAPHAFVVAVACDAAKTSASRSRAAPSKKRWAKRAGRSASGPTELKEGEGRIVEVSALRHSHHGGAASEDLLLALLTHPVTSLRGVAAIEFPRAGTGSPSTRSPAFYAVWQQAFLEAPIVDHHNWQLGQHLNALAAADPKLVTAWLLRRAADGEAMWRLEFERKLDISTMPRLDKDELMRSMPAKYKGEVLGLMLGEDRDWASSLVDAGVCSIDDVWHAIARRNHDGVTAAETLAWAPTLRRHGAAEGDVLRLMDLGHVGPESGHYAKLKEALEAEPAAADAAAEDVRQTGIRMFADAERGALEREHRERVTGRVH